MNFSFIKKIRQQNVQIVLMISKYVFSFILICLATYRIGNFLYFLVGLLELLIIASLSNGLLDKYPRSARILNGILLLLLNAQMGVMFFGNSFINMIMLTNLASLEALSGRATLYISSVIVVVIFSLWPITHLRFTQKDTFSLCMLSFLFNVLILMLCGVRFSPLFNYADLGIQFAKAAKQKQEIRDAAVRFMEENPELVQELYHEEITDYIAQDPSLPENPNIILIFTEGLSQSVIDDEREIMPNVANYQQQSLQFVNYYNHTFATFRGLIGQLYSGYQLEDFDSNALVSMQSILADEGYETIFINSEPHNATFTKYLKNFEFEHFYGTKDDECNGVSNSISDKDVYNMLFDLAEDYSKKEAPFFLCTYTFGTHVSQDSVDQKYGNGSDSVLNRFYDADYQFGKFMEKFENSDFAEDTIIVFTADHATYQDDMFNNTFSNYYRVTPAMDEVPFFIYYPGVTPETIDVNGRNSVCLAPTVLDYIDVSAPNFFVGTSLFSGTAGSVCEVYHNHVDTYYTSENNTMKMLKDSEVPAELKDIMQNYFILKEAYALQQNN